MLAAPPPEKSAPKAGEKAGEKDDEAKGSLTEPLNKLAIRPINSSSGDSKGTVFLVGTKSRQVIWSVYELPKNSTSKEMDRIASDIVSRLKKDMGFAKK